MRNSMLWSVVAFAGVWLAGMAVLGHFGPDPAGISEAVPSPVSGATRYGIIAMHILMAAYFAHLLARTIYLTVKSRDVVRIS